MGMMIYMKNERIKELAEEAGFPKFDKMYVVTDGEELIKFAELIEQECWAEHCADSLELEGDE